MQKKIFGLLAGLFALTFLFSSCSFSKKNTVHQKDIVAMGSAVTMKVYESTLSEEETETLLTSALQQVTDLDARYLSKNLESAELYKLNHAEGKEHLPLSPTLYNVLSKTKEVYAHSNGMAAVASGALTELWGIDTDTFALPQEQAIQKALPSCQDDTLQLHEDGTISFQDGQILNLGSVGKGMACDVAIEAIRSAMEQQTISGAIVSVGGSLGFIGSANANGDGYRIGIRNPFGNANSYFATLTMHEGFLSTSGTYEKTFQKDGKTYHHLLDLNKGYPKETNLVSVTILAENGLLSDALSTLCFLLGEEASKPILKAYDASAIFVYADKRVHISPALQEAFQVTEENKTSFSVEVIL